MRHGGRGGYLKMNGNNAFYQERLLTHLGGTYKRYIFRIKNFWIYNSIYVGLVGKDWYMTKKKKYDWKNGQEWVILPGYVAYPGFIVSFGGL